MDFVKAVEYVSNIEKFGSHLGLETINNLLDRLSRPDKGMKFVHVAGTNGKGSVTAFLTSILNEQGYNVGTFNSPSVFCYNERFLLSGKTASNKDIASVISSVKTVRDKMEKENLSLPTAFEIEFAAALLLFKEKKCDIVVLETGLGGRLDATNAVLKKEVAAITKIAFDHTAILGKTLFEIASEKAAIVKNCPLVTLSQDNEVMSAFKNINDLRVAETATLLSDDIKGQYFLYKGKRYFTKLLGSHQLINAALAIETAKVLNEKNIFVSDYAISNGIKKARIKGRFEIKKFGDGKINRYFILDGAHNPDGAAALQKSLEHYFKDIPISLVFGMFEDKDYKTVAETLTKGKHAIYIVKPNSKRGLDGNKMLEIVKPFCQNSQVYPSEYEAVRAAINSDAQVVCVCGSLSILNNSEQAFLKLTDTKSLKKEPPIGKACQYK